MTTQTFTVLHKYHLWDTVYAAYNPQRPKLPPLLLFSSTSVLQMSSYYEETLEVLLSPANCKAWLALPVGKPKWVKPCKATDLKGVINSWRCWQKRPSEIKRLKLKQLFLCQAYLVLGCIENKLYFLKYIFKLIILKLHV